MLIESSQAVIELPSTSCSYIKSERFWIRPTAKELRSLQLKWIPMPIGLKGVSALAVGVLHTLCSSPPTHRWSTERLAKACRLSKHVVGIAVRQLEKAGLVERKPASHRGKMVGQVWFMHPFGKNVSTKLLEMRKKEADRIARDRRLREVGINPRHVDEYLAISALYSGGTDNGPSSDQVGPGSNDGG